MAPRSPCSNDAPTQGEAGARGTCLAMSPVEAVARQSRPIVARQSRPILVRKEWSMRDRLMLRSSAVLTAVLLGIFLAVVPRPAFAQADKYAAAGSTTIIFGPFFTGSTTADLLKEDIQSSNTVDLDLQVTLECGLITQESGFFTFNDASLTVWIEIDGVVVPITSTSNGTPTDPTPV